MSHPWFMQMLGCPPSDKESGSEHGHADRETGEIFQLSDPVGELMVGGATNGADGENGGQNGEKVGKLFQDIPENRDRA